MTVYLHVDDVKHGIHVRQKQVQVQLCIQQLTTFDCNLLSAAMTLHEEDAERLLRVPMLSDGNELDDDPTAGNGTPANLKLELCGLLSLSAPVMVQLSAQYAVTVVNQYFIGHQGAGPLAAAAIGNTVSVPVNLWPRPLLCAELALRCVPELQSLALLLCSGSTCAGTS